MSRRGSTALAAGAVGVGALAAARPVLPFDAAGTAHLTGALLDVGLDEPAIRAVMGENALRVLGEALP